MTRHHDFQQCFRDGRNSARSVSSHFEGCGAGEIPEAPAMARDAAVPKVFDGLEQSARAAVCDATAGPIRETGDPTAEIDTPGTTDAARGWPGRGGTLSETERHPFHVLLPQHSQSLRYRALKLTSNHHRAEDLVQGTLLKAWSNRDSYRPDTRLRAWLFTILYNTFISDLRKYRREVEDVDGAMAAALFEAPRQDHVLALKELIQAIALLPDIQRWPILLMGAYGYSQLEAADACGCTVGTIKSRVSRGRAGLDRVLADEPVYRRDTPRRAASPGGASGTALMAEWPRRKKKTGCRSR